MPGEAGTESTPGSVTQPFLQSCILQSPAAAVAVRRGQAERVQHEEGPMPWVPLPATAAVLKALLEPQAVMEFAYSRSLKDG